MYFYPAVITERLGPEEVKVSFTADRIERRLRTEGGVITVDQLRPGDQLSVKHDVYSAYEVTAVLLKLTKRVERFEFDKAPLRMLVPINPLLSSQTRVA